jgi:hypothetical protein
MVCVLLSEIDWRGSARPVRGVPALLQFVVAGFTGGGPLQRDLRFLSIRDGGARGSRVAE